MSENSLRPNEKVTSGIAWGSFATIAVTAIAVFAPDQFARIPPGFETALGVFIGSLASTGAAYMKPSK